jgi:hypothetical protein
MPPIPASNYPTRCAWYWPDARPVPEIWEDDPGRRKKPETSFFVSFCVISRIALQIHVNLLSVQTRSYVNVSRPGIRRLTTLLAVVTFAVSAIIHQIERI